MLILSPLSFALINQLGWRQTLIVLSGITALTTLGTITYASKKQMTSSSPGGASPAQVEHFRNVDIVTTIKHIWSSRRFLVFLLSAACVEFGNSVPYMFLVSFKFVVVKQTTEQQCLHLVSKCLSSKSKPRSNNTRKSAAICVIPGTICNK